MPVTPTYPGVYVDELPSPVHTIIGVATSVAAFVGTAERGLIDSPQHINSFSDYQRAFGGVSAAHPMSYAAYQFYLNGGSQAEVVRVVASSGRSTFATITLPANADGSGTNSTLNAISPGVWGNRLRARVDWSPASPPVSPEALSRPQLWNLTIRDTGTGAEERFLNIDPTAAVGSPRSLSMTLKASRLVRAATPPANDSAPAAALPVAAGSDPFTDQVTVTGGVATLPASGAPATRSADTENEPTSRGYLWIQALTDGATADPAPALSDYAPSAEDGGIYLLRQTDIFNMLVLCLPEGNAVVDFDSTVLAPAAKLCNDRRAMLLVDPPSGWGDVNTAADGVDEVRIEVGGDVAANAVVYFPRLTIADPDPAMRGLSRELPPAGTVAGVWARTDAQRGVWKAPAGQDASLGGVLAPNPLLTDLENGQLNPLGINCLRTFPLVGPVVWGARTLNGADILEDQWKYLPVRRTALFVEESLFRGTKWVVFEPNAEPLWSAIRLNVGTFMNGLFRQGAFAGSTPAEAFLVKCDAENNPQEDIDRGIVNILVGFSPLKPAEFVMIHIEQLAGQTGP